MSFPLQQQCADCERVFGLRSMLQYQRGLTPHGWLCPTCRFNEWGSAFVGFVKRVANV